VSRALHRTVSLLETSAVAQEVPHREGIAVARGMLVSADLCIAAQTCTSQRVTLWSR